MLILDEPTNHLDIRTKDILKQAIKDFNGTVIVVSHDRDFLDGLVDKVFEFGGGRVKEHLGGIYDFLRTKNLESLKDIEKNIPAKKPQNEAEPEMSAGKKSYFEQKEFEKTLRKAQKKVSEAEARIEKIESEIAEVEAELASGNVSDDLCKKHGDLQVQLENAMSDWETASIELDTLKEG